MSHLVTEHFLLEEFMSHDGEPYPLSWVDDRLKTLCVILEVIRAAFGGRSVFVVSGYRSPAHNAAIGGAQASQHMEGRAADIRVIGVTAGEVHAKVLELFGAGQLQGLGGLGAYPGWTHVDIRPWIGHLAQWSGAKFGDEQAA